jgi:2-dehydro-3-deoxy-D-arabinonate dehydratase
MKIYKTGKGIAIEDGQRLYLVADQDWDNFINDDALYEKVSEIVKHRQPEEANGILSDLAAPVGSQEIWACGVTYLRSKIGRQEESKDAGGGDFYARVYEAERPEVFFKSTAHRTVGHKGAVRIRKDSVWDVPEPELTLVVTSSGRIVGYTIGNDMSSRSIEGENPLYLPQAKTYDGCAAIGPCILVTDRPLDASTVIQMSISRDGRTVFEGSVTLAQMKRNPEELVGFVFRECSFPAGALIMTGTGIVPGNDFTLKRGDIIKISIDGIGTLENFVGA